MSLCLLLAAPLAALAAQDWPVHSMDRPRPPVVVPAPAGAPVPPPQDAIVLFGTGSRLEEWQSGEGAAARWTVGSGWFEVAAGSGSLTTRRSFGDVQLHLEWASPGTPTGRGQARGNSGVFLMGYYEIQILDSHGDADTYPDGQAASLYGQYPPMVNASRAPGHWQTYDIIFRRPRFNADGTLARPARMTVFHNGVLVHDNVTLQGRTAHQRRAAYEAHEDRRPLSLQDHGDRVRFRNVWVRELPEQP